MCLANPPLFLVNRNSKFKHYIKQMLLSPHPVISSDEHGISPIPN